MMAIMCKAARMVKLELVFASIYASTAGVQKLAGMLKASHSMVHECLFTVGMATGYSTCCGNVESVKKLEVTL